MSLKGTGTNESLLRGTINNLDVLTISAYGIAVKNGFDGTEEEWLLSLHGDAGLSIDSVEINEV